MPLPLVAEAWTPELRAFAEAYEIAAKERYESAGIEHRNSRLMATRFARKKHGSPLTKPELKQAMEEVRSFAAHIKATEVEYHQEWDRNLKDAPGEGLGKAKIRSGGEKYAENRAEFLRVLEHEMNHHEAQVASGIRWEAVQKLLRDDEEFRKGYELIMPPIEDPMNYPKAAARALDTQMIAAYVVGNHTAARNLSMMMDPRFKAPRGRPKKKGDDVFTPDADTLSKADAVYASMMAPAGAEN